MRAEFTGSGSGEAGGAIATLAPCRLSDVLLDLSRRAGERVSMAEICDCLGDRGFAALLVFFGALNLLPLPPGSSALLGLPIVVVAAQMTFGMERVWLPSFIANRSMSGDQFRNVIERIVPRMARVETLVRPRYWPFWRKHGERIVGIVTLLLSIIVTLPIPLGNWLPALAITLLGMAVTERDGVLLGAGCGVAIAALCVVILVVGAAGAATQAVFGWLF